MTSEPPASPTPPPPLSIGGTPYIRNESAIQDIVKHVRDGHYCTVLGPPYCQKSLLLRDVVDRLAATGEEICIPINLHDMPSAVDEEFLLHFWATFSEALQQTGRCRDVPSLDGGSERDLQNALQSAVAGADHNIVLVLDHLERVRPAPMKALLRVLRAIFTEHSQEAPRRLAVVTANSLSTASLALGKTSPFNIAHIIWIDDLTPEQSQQLIEWLCQRTASTADAAARQRLIDATGGDRDLIRKLCKRCGVVDPGQAPRTLTIANVEEAIAQFVESEAVTHPPFQDMIRGIEADPETLLNVLAVLERGCVPRNQLALDDMADVDAVRLSGAVRLASEGGKPAYRIRNEIYRRCIERHFSQARVASVLSMAGRWEEALPQLAHSSTRSSEHRLTLLSTLANAIYTAESVESACTFLAPSLAQAFGIPRLSLYLVSPERAHLRLMGSFGDNVWQPAVAITDLAAPEVAAFLHEDYSVLRAPDGEPVLMVPLRGGNHNAIGVIVVRGLPPIPLSEKFQEFLASLGPLGQALNAVGEREEKLRQFAVLHRTAEQITRSLDLTLVLDSILDAAMSAVPAAQKASLFAWDDVKGKLVIKAQRGFSESVAERVQLAIGQGAAGYVFATGESLVLDDALKSDKPPMEYTDNDDNRDLKSTVLVPLFAWARVIGVLCLDNVSVYRAFSEKDARLLATLGAQAATAIQNATIHTELYQLGMNLNRGALSPQDIFQETVQSILRVTGAAGANMLLLRDTDKPAQCLLQSPSLAVSSPSLGPDYQKKVRPRPDGLTHAVLVERRALAVERPDQPPGINPTAAERGTQAYVCLPLMVQETITGVLFVHYNQPHTLSSNEINVISLFANQAALAIVNADQRKRLEIMDAVAWMGITFSSLAHRITQKAGAILNTAYGLQKRIHEPEVVRAGLQQISQYAGQVQEVPRGALLPVKGQEIPIDLAEFVQAAASRWCQPKVQLQFEDRAAGAAIILADRSRIETLLEIMTTNAVRSALEGDEPGQVWFRTYVDHSSVIVQIKNTGREIPEDVRGRLFQEPIAKTNTADGTGVGLLIARTIVERYGGAINLDPSTDTLTTFSFSLPLRAAHAKPSA